MTCIVVGLIVGLLAAAVGVGLLALWWVARELARERGEWM